MAVTCFNVRIMGRFLSSLIFVTTLSLAESNSSSKTSEGLPLPISEIKKQPLVKSRWLLLSIKGKPLFPGTIITLEFPKRFGYKFVYGLFKNNRHYDGIYTLRPNDRFTLVACCQLSLNGAPEGTQEHDYTVILFSITRYKIEGELLSFFDPKGEVILQYRKLPESESSPNDLLDKTWQLVSATTMEDADLASFTLSFAAKQPIKIREETDSAEFYLRPKNQLVFDGSTSCQNYKGRYYAVENMLAVSSLSRTSKFSEYLTVQDMIALDRNIDANSKNEQQISRYFFRLLSNLQFQGAFDLFCSKKDIIAKDSYLELLKNVWHYEVSATQLELYSDQNNKLVFELALNP
jgi:hypothetical protein